MEILLIIIAAFITAILTFFSGFGLGTILTPVFAIFFRIDLAIALTGLVHFCNNLFKLIIAGKFANKNVLTHFGIPAIFASFAGAYLLLKITGMRSVFQYYIGVHEFTVTPVKLIIASLLLIFSIIEITPSLRNIQINRNLIFGGILSGFFGGLSGLQGAIRSAFLIRSGLSKEAYIGTGVVIACFIDFTRLSVYATHVKNTNLAQNVPLIIAAVLSALLGSFIGSKLLKKVTFNFIQIMVALLLIIISLALGIGLI